MVNNAGSAPGGIIEHLSEADWAQALQLKFMGYVRCLRHVLPLMVKQGGGRVVNLIGNDGRKPSYWEVAPGAANAAGYNLTLSLAGQYGKHGISLVAVNPGPVRTERWAGLVKAMSRDMNLSYEDADKLAPSSIPMGRIAETEEVADLVVMLASPRTHYVNGTMIEIDGGQEKALMDRAHATTEGAWFACRLAHEPSLSLLMSPPPHDRQITPSKHHRRRAPRPFWRDADPRRAGEGLFGPTASDPVLRERQYWRGGSTIHRRSSLIQRTHGVLHGACGPAYRRFRR